MRHAIGFYVALIAVLAVLNARSTETLSEVEIPKPLMRFDQIPLAYMDAHFPSGHIPEDVQSSHVRTFVLQATRGWPGWFQNDFGYQYELVTPETGSTTTIRGFPHAKQTPWFQRIRWSTLFGNMIGLISCVGLLHVSAVLFSRSIRQTATASTPHTAIVGEQ